MDKLLHYYYTTCSGERVVACSRVKRIKKAAGGFWVTFYNIYGGDCKIFIDDPDIIQVQEVSA